MGKDKLLIIQIFIADLILMSATVALTYGISLLFNPMWMNGVNNLPKLIVLYDTCFLACQALYPSVIHERMVRMEAIVQRVITVSALLLLFSSVLTAFIEAQIHFPRTYTFITVSTFAVFYLIQRIIISKLLKDARRKRRNLTEVILVGKEPTIENLYNILSIPHYGYDIRGIFYDGESDNADFQKLHLGGIDQIYSYLTQHTEIKEIYGHFAKRDKDQINMLTKFCDNHLVRFFFVPELEVFSGNLAFYMIEGVPVVARREEPLSNPVNKAKKRLFDILVSGIFLITVFPWILLIVGIIIKIKSPGPIFFKQDRTGVDGNIFKCIKFRTMKVNDQADSVQATENDPRKYPFGDFMRRTNIDELPQFINVFLGDMSLVGPRPHMLMHTEEYSRIINKFMVRHFAKPGITGLAQVSGYRGETRYIDQMEGRVKLDIEYVENWSFLLDLKIMVKTVTNMLGKEENAY